MIFYGIFQNLRLESSNFCENRTYIEGVLLVGQGYNW